MIKFFRKIRQHLLAENKFSKYLIYAIGEIILVVIGILIALQINNWNDKRKDRQRENIILNQLHNQFLENQRLFNLGIGIFENKLSRLNRINSFSELPDKERADSLSRYLQDIFTGYTYNPYNGLIESLLGSASIEVIQNDSIKSLLVSWKDVIVDYKEEEDQIHEDINNLNHYFYRNMDYSNIRTSDKGLNTKNIKAFNTTEFHNHVVKIQFSTSFLLNGSEREIVENYLKEIIRLSETK